MQSTLTEFEDNNGLLNEGAEDPTTTTEIPEPQTEPG